VHLKHSVKVSGASSTPLTSVKGTLVQYKHSVKVLGAGSTPLTMVKGTLVQYKHPTNDGKRYSGAV